MEKPIIGAGLDTGSERTRCVIGEWDGEAMRLLGCGEAESAGWGKGRVVDPGALSEAILRAVKAAEQLAGVAVESAVLGVGGPTVRAGNSRSTIELGRPREIEPRDVTRVTDRASRVQLQDDRMVLQVCLQDFMVEDHPGQRDPRKLVASRLEANFHVITASVLEQNALVTATNQAHLSVQETIFEPFAASYSAILPEERREGIALLDIGAHSTGLVVYYGDALQLASSLQICGDHFTRDVARGLCTTYEDAALLKKEYGCAVVGFTSDNSLIEVPSPDGREAREAPRRKLNQILEARAEELFRYVRRELARVGMDQALMGGVVLTGGGAMLPGILDMAERVLNCQARNGLVLGVKDWPDEIDNPEWSVAAGLMMYSVKLKANADATKRSVGLLGRMMK